MKKILVLGNVENAKHHSLENIKKPLRKLLEPFGEVVFCTDFYFYTQDEFEKYDLIVDYIDNIPQEVQDDITESLINYIAFGGKVLALHNGVIKSAPELRQIYGGSFIMHPPYTLLQFVPSPSHTITAGIEPFALEEEPYILEENYFNLKNVFLHYQYGNMLIPCGWESDFISGKILYLSLGHNAYSFCSPFNKILENSVLFLLREGIKGERI